MIISKFEISAAQREAAKDRAHEMCIDKIMELSSTNARQKAQIERLQASLKEWQTSVDQNVFSK